MDKQLQTLYLKNNRKIILDSSTADKRSVSIATAIVANFNSIGFSVSKDLYEKMCQISSDSLIGMYNKTFPTLKEMVGANREYQTLFPNFPEDILEHDEAELLYAQIMHYMGAAIFFDQDADAKLYLVDGEKKETLEYNEKSKLLELNLGSEKDCYATIKKLLESYISLPDYKKEYISCFLKAVPSYVILENMPAKMPNKENLAFISGELINLNKDKKLSQKNLTQILGIYIKTATDVLRFATALSNGDVSLTQNTRFRKFNNAEKRLIMSLLEKDSSLKENMQKNVERFKRLLQPFHVLSKETAEKYPKLAKVYKEAVNNERDLTYLGKVQDLLDKGDDNALNLLANRPGIFAEKLNECLRKLDRERTLTMFEGVATKLSVPLLLRVQNAFKNMNDKEFRVYKPKNKPMFCEANEQENLKDSVIKRVDTICNEAMKEIFAGKEEMGKVYIDPNIKGLATPLVMRDKSEGTKFIAEGSKIEANHDKNYIRVNIWWTNGLKPGRTYDDYENRIDIDQSCAFWDKDFQRVAEAAYYTNKKNDFYTCSGDITNGGPSDGNGVAEFIDIDKEKMKEAGVAYVTVAVNIFSGANTFDDMKNVAFSFQEREDPFLGKDYEPSAVETKIELNTKARAITTVMYDVEKDRFIWIEKELNNSRTQYHALSGVAAQLYNYTQLERPQLYDLIKLHAESRGEIVDTPEEADIVFREERLDLPENIKVISPYDAEVFVSEFLDGEYREENIPERLRETEEIEEPNNILSEISDFDEVINEVNKESEQYNNMSDMGKNLTKQFGSRSDR